jgi:pantoate--beta-alanine ligase
MRAGLRVSMRIIEQPAELQAWALERRAAGRRIGLVPTMGNLHEGHLSLVRLAKAGADETVVSVFVNPLQFGPNEDYAAYPRTFAEDCAKCGAEGVDVVFHPAPDAMYAPGASTTVRESALTGVLCGASRPGHFEGVCTVVCKLFHLALPHVAVFGEKDAQQLRVIRRMVRDLDFPLEIVPGPIVREADGLAMSSRNRFIPAGMRGQALCLRRALDAAEAAFAAGERRVEALRGLMAETVRRVAPDGEVDYISLNDDETLEPLDGEISRPALAALAVRVGGPRLIDNARLVP